jgi:flagellar protein FliO/FliZ
MLDTLFGQMPLALKFFMVFLVILAVIAAIAWALRRFGSGRLGATTRGRQPRLAVIDYATVDSRRRLILVRRDNVEHLLMIGGPGDVVVEPNIVRAAAPPRDMVRAPAGLETLPRAIPLPESSASWPLQPESNGARPRIEHYPEELPGRPSPSEPAPRHSLAALADELSNRPAPQVPLRGRPSITAPHQDHRPEPRLESRRPPVQPPVPPPAPPASVALPAGAADGPNAADQNLADMAQRLEAALRKPNSEGRPSLTQRSIPTPETKARDDAPPPPPRVARAADPRPDPRPEARSEPRADARAEPRLDSRPEQRAARPEIKPNQNKTAIYDTLEQEMANLLGRPGKS